MSQSTLIVGAIFAAWIVWITIKGELSSYIGIFGGTGGTTSSPLGTSGPGSAAQLNPGGLSSSAMSTSTTQPGFSGGNANFTSSLTAGAANGSGVGVSGDYGGGGDVTGSGP